MHPGAKPRLRTPHPCPQSCGLEHVGSKKHPILIPVCTPPEVGVGPVSEAGSGSRLLPRCPPRPLATGLLLPGRGLAAYFFPLARPASRTHLSQRAPCWEWPGDEGTGCPPLQGSVTIIHKPPITDILLIQGPEQLAH